MMWPEKYVGVPFVDGGRTIEGLDCWGLVCLIYAEQLGVDLPSYGDVSARDLLAIARAIEGGREPWQPVDKPQAFDVVSMRFYNRSWVGHVGVMVDGTQMIHTEETIAAAIIPVSHYTVRDRISGYWRLA